jgi:hypothetical protein
LGEGKHQLPFFSLSSVKLAALSQRRERSGTAFGLLLTAFCLLPSNLTAADSNAGSASTADYGVAVAVGGTPGRLSICWVSIATF